MKHFGEKKTEKMLLKFMEANMVRFCFATAQHIKLFM